jgi:hypothetical protein
VVTIEFADIAFGAKKNSATSCCTLVTQSRNCPPLMARSNWRAEVTKQSMLEHAVARADDALDIGSGKEKSANKKGTSRSISGRSAARGLRYPLGPAANQFAQMIYFPLAADAAFDVGQ